MQTNQPIVTCLWFDGQAEDAVNFYTSVFKNSSVGRITRYQEAGREIHGQEPGTLLAVNFELNGRPFMALNGGPMYKFTEAISFQVMCESQEEVDYYWDRLGEGGNPAAQVCGWLKDKFGVSWQVVPNALIEFITDPDPEKSGRAMAAMMQMTKMDIAGLRAAYEGR